MVNVIYRRECICDLCGTKLDVPGDEKFLPRNWDRINLGMKHYDVCVKCFAKVDMAIEDLIVRED